jgi:glutamate-1-semialdehyde 2,1-aminomutase
MNARMEAEGLPVRAANMSSVWTVTYTTPSRYNWMFQFYLRLQGLALSWIGTGRLIFSLNLKQDEFNAMLERFVLAAHEMQKDGWWWTDARQSNRGIRRSILREMLAHR